MRETGVSLWSKGGDLTQIWRYISKELPKRPVIIMSHRHLRWISRPESMQYRTREGGEVRMIPWLYVANDDAYAVILISGYLRIGTRLWLVVYRRSPLFR